MPKIYIDQTQYYYELSGQGYPLVLIAGYSCDHSFFENMLKELSKHFLVLTFDNRAIGQTKDQGQALSLEIMADDTIKLVRALQLFRPHILGQSMGGGIAQIIARKYPDDIGKMIILNSSAIINQRTLMALGSFVNLLKQKVSFDAVVEVSMPWLLGIDFLSDPRNIISYKNKIKNNPYPPSIADIERQLIALQGFNFSWAHEIKASTLVISANQDICCLPAESDELAGHLMQAQRAQVLGGHCSPLEQADAVNKLIINFLQKP